MPRKQSKIKVQRKHGFWVFLAFLGFLLPPLAVLARFGVGTDLFINIILTIAGYIPGHAHNFYLQNIRNNKNKGRSPQWAIKAGLVSDPNKKKAKQSAWANRYNERTDTRGDYDDYDTESVASSNPRPRNPNNPVDSGFGGGTEGGTPALGRRRSRSFSAGSTSGRRSLEPSRNDLDDDASSVYSFHRGTSNRSRSGSLIAAGHDFSDLPGAGDRAHKEKKKKLGKKKSKDKGLGVGGRSGRYGGGSDDFDAGADKLMAAEGRARQREEIEAQANAGGGRTTATDGLDHQF